MARCAMVPLLLAATIGMAGGVVAKEKTLLCTSTMPRPRKTKGQKRACSTVPPTCARMARAHRRMTPQQRSAAGFVSWTSTSGTEKERREPMLAAHASMFWSQ
jgi:hypothetical protein